jgi:hypothetical protein
MSDPVKVTDQARADYAAGRIDRATALSRIRGTYLALTWVGINDLLDADLDAEQRYAAHQ